MKGLDGPSCLYTQPKFPTQDSALQHLPCKFADVPEIGRENVAILQRKMFKPIGLNKGCIFLNIFKLKGWKMLCSGSLHQNIYPRAFNDKKENQDFSKEIPHFRICCWMSCSPWPEENLCPYMGAIEVISNPIQPAASGTQALPSVHCQWATWFSLPEL